MAVLLVNYNSRAECDWHSTVASSILTNVRTNLSGDRFPLVGKGEVTLAQDTLVRRSNRNQEGHFTDANVHGA